MNVINLLTLLNLCNGIALIIIAAMLHPHPVCLSCTDVLFLMIFSADNKRRKLGLIGLAHATCMHA